MHRPLLILLAFLLSVWGGSAVALAAQEVVAPHVRVLFDDPALEPYAQRVAAEAEAALDALTPLFGPPPLPVTLRLENTTDLYNALASPLPRPNIGLRALFPTEVALSYRAESDLRLLLIHELTHLLQSGYLEGRGDGPRLGLVGEGVANVPPLWLVEGLAVWTESRLTAGGRLGDALTRGVLESAAHAGTWPTLADASLSTYGAWPGVGTRYLFGGAFTDFLVRRHGFAALKASLAQHNAGGFLRPFAASWRRAVGTDLEDEWRSWRGEVTARAARRAAQVRAAGRAGERRTESGWFTGAPALSPDGEKLAWVGWPAAIMIAEVRGSDLGEPRTLLVDRLPGKLEWLDAHTLLYARPTPQPGRTYSELFTLDVRSGRETQLTTGARAKLPAALPGGCALYVTDDAARSKLVQTCPGEVARTRWQAPTGTHIVGLATSRGGRIALSVWRRGAVDLALLEGGALRYLTRDRAQDLEPSWRDEVTLLFRSDRDPAGVFELYELEVDRPATLAQLTRTLGGALSPEAGARGSWFVRVGGRGYDVAWLPAGTPVAVAKRSHSAAGDAAAGAPGRETGQTPRPAGAPRFAVRAYTPLASLRPYGWLPTGGGVSLAPLGAAAEVSLLAQDDSADHSARLALGFDSARAALAGFYAFARYEFGAGIPLRATPRPLRASLQAGAWPQLPHRSERLETVAGVRVGLSGRLPQDTALLSFGLEAGLVQVLLADSGPVFDARAEGAFSTQRADAWGYRTQGARAALTGVWSATGGAPSLGAWADGSYVEPVAGVGRLEFGVVAGYRPAWPLPLTARSDLAALVSAGVSRSLPLELRYGDGLYAVERFTLEPRLRMWFDGALHLGGDLSVALDTVLGYGAPVSVFGTLGYATDLWTRVGVRLPL